MKQKMRKSRKTMVDAELSIERLAKLEAQVEIIKESVSELRGDIKDIHSRITTSNREIVEKIDDMQTRLEHKMNASSEMQNAAHLKISKAVSEDLTDLRKRVDTLEQWKWYVIGGVAMIGYMIGHLEFFSKFLK